MERCRLMLAAPTAEELSRANSDKTVTISNSPFSLDIWIINSGKPISPDSLSWWSKPERNELLMSYHVLPGTAVYAESPEFVCPSGSLQTFEVSCRSENCLLQFQQDVSMPRLGEYDESVYNIPNR